MAKRHYSDADFIQTSSARDGAYGCQQGYCRICGGDMQRFLSGDKWGPVRHYNSHKNGGVKRPLPKREPAMTALEKMGLT